MSSCLPCGTPHVPMPFSRRPGLEDAGWGPGDTRPGVIPARYPSRQVPTKFAVYRRFPPVFEGCTPIQAGTWPPAMELFELEGGVGEVFVAGLFSRICDGFQQNKFSCRSIVGEPRRLVDTAGLRLAPLAGARITPAAGDPGVHRTEQG
jgi:hypothetical protein